MELLRELQAVWAAVPMPGESWHPWTPELRRLAEVVRAAAAALESDEAAQRELAALVEAEEPPAPGEPGGELGAAVQLLAQLPRPVGHHPFLLEIVPGLEAAHVLLAAVERSPAARARFEELARSPAV